MKPLTLGLAMLISGVAGARGQAPAIGIRPVFVPGLYETETRDSAAQREGLKRRTCIAAANYDAFRRQTIADYLKLPQFLSVCRLSETREIADGFAFAMDCDGSKTLIAFHVGKDLIRATTRTVIAARPEYSSTSLAVSRRIGACTGQAAPDEAL